jgi:hypothetical protein
MERFVMIHALVLNDTLFAGISFEGDCRVGCASSQ